MRSLRQQRDASHAFWLGRHVMLGGAVLSVSACSAWRPVVEPTPVEGTASTATYWIPRARVTLTRGDAIMLRGVTLTRDSLIGTTPDSVVHRYARGDVSRVERQHIRPDRTIALVLVSAYASLMLLLLLAAWGLSD